MNLYKAKVKFDAETGKRLKRPTVVKTRDAICDYTGELIKYSEDRDMYPQYTLTLDYDCESYYHDKDAEFFRDLGLDYSSLFDDKEYHFAVLGDYAGNVDMSQMLMSEWVGQMSAKVGPFATCGNVEEVLRKARVETVKRLIKEKKYTPEELGLLEEF